MNKTKEVLTALAADVLTALVLCGPAAAVFAPSSALSAPDPEISAATQWGDIRPTNSVGSVFSAAGFAPTGYVHEVASQAFTPLADAVGVAQRTAEAATTTNAQQTAAIAELADTASALNDTKFDKSGGTLTGNLVIHPSSSTPDARLTLDGGADSIVSYKLGSIDRQHSTAGGLLVTDTFTYPSTSGTFALAASNPTDGNLAALDTNGNPTDSGKSVADFLSAAPLAGRTYDFATTQGVMDALAAVIATLGGTVTNNPSTTAE